MNREYSPVKFTVVKRSNQFNLIVSESKGLITRA